jgi:hypothetical protein
VWPEAFAGLLQECEDKRSANTGKTEMKSVFEISFAGKT